MIIPLWTILLLWSIFAGVVILLSLINLYHILHYGFWTFRAALFSFLYYGVVASVFYWVWQNLPALDWSQPWFTIAQTVLTLPSSF